MLTSPTPSYMPIGARCAPRFGQSVAVTSPVLISPYDPRWPKRASVLIEELRAALGGKALRIEHIGSTAIPMMDAKDLLDVQISVADLDVAVERFDHPLKAMGFERFPSSAITCPPGNRTTRRDGSSGSGSAGIHRMGT